MTSTWSGRSDRVTGATSVTTQHPVVSLALIGLLVPVAGGRWGSYLAIPGPRVYFADVLVLIGLTALIMMRLRNRERVQASLRPPTVLQTGSLVLLVLLGSSLIVSSWTTPLLVVRDAMPILYLALTPLFYQVVVLCGETRLRRFLVVACALHTLWFTPAVLGLLPEVDAPAVAAIPLFTPRGDYDVLIAGFSVAVFAFDRTLPTALRFVFGVSAAVSVFAGGSRAGLISGLLVMVTAGLLARPKWLRLPPAGVACVFLGVAVAIPATLLVVIDPPEWMRGLSRVFAVGTPQHVGAVNTWNARLFAWERLAQFTNDDPVRALWGTGLGSQPIRDSGALAYLSGNASVRAAHNFVFTWYAFFGAVGAGVLFLVIVVWLIVAFRSSLHHRGLTGLGFALSLGATIAGLGGVILESPFGYMSFVLGVVVAMMPAPETTASEVDSYTTVARSRQHPHASPQ